jgi:hypothetical protein
MMAKSADQANVQELVARFVSIGLAQYDALYVADTKKFNRLYAMMADVRSELKSREGDSAAHCCHCSTIRTCKFE